MSTIQDIANSLSNSLLSKILSGVMEDIGVNDEMVKTRRKASMLRATLATFAFNDTYETYIYHFGSQSEGSTTIDLKSDYDIMQCLYHVNVIQDRSEHKPESNSLLVIQDNNIFPSYCHLQLIRSDESSDQVLIVSDRVDLLKHCVTDNDGRLLLNTTSLIYGLFNIPPDSEGSSIKRHGPALTDTSGQGLYVDNLFCFYGETLPHQVQAWLKQREECGWPSYDVLENCRKAGCFLVPADSKLSPTPELEWRISTHLQERYIMFSLNSIQLGCYILMKIILKCYINPVSPDVEDVLSSYMCKNVLLYCISESPHDWHTDSLLSKLTLCLVRLQKCVKRVNCPHFIVPENNLMAGRMTDRQRNLLSTIIHAIVVDITKFVFDIKIDRIGDRMRLKLCGVLRGFPPEPAGLISQYILLDLIRSTATEQKQVLCMALNRAESKVLLTTLRVLKNKIHELRYLTQCSESDIEKKFPHTDIGAIQTACRLVTPLVSSTVGSLLAGRDIASNKPVSDEAFSYLTEGKDSDVLSGRLKLVSVLYCSGDMKRTDEELEATFGHYHNNQPVITVCGCYFGYYEKESVLMFDDFSENSIKSKIALCVTFHPHEINCVPRELKFEILRTYGEDKQMRSSLDDRDWMNWIVVDTIPFLHYLQYEIYGRLQRRGKQLRALQCLADSVNISNLGHRETVLNLLGQCFEKERIQNVALKYYINSLEHRKRNNAARFLLCLQLFKLRKHN